jgi:hypothetical protein
MDSRLEKLEGLDLAPLMFTVTVASDEELEQKKMEVLDKRGNPVMVQVDERYVAVVGPDTGAITSELQLIMAPKLRDLTNEELAPLKEKAKRDRDELAAVAVQEVDPEEPA